MVSAIWRFWLPEAVRCIFELSFFVFFRYARRSISPVFFSFIFFIWVLPRKTDRIFFLIPMDSCPLLFIGIFSWIVSRSAAGAFLPLCACFRIFFSSFLQCFLPEEEPSLLLSSIRFYSGLFFWKGSSFSSEEREMGRSWSG